PRDRASPGVDLLAAAPAPRRLQPGGADARADGARGRRVGGVGCEGARGDRPPHRRVTAAPSPRLYTPEFLRACALHFTGGMSLPLFLPFPLYVKDLGGSETTIGLVLGVGAAASVGARPLVGLLLDRVGRRRVLLWCGVGNVLSWIPFLLLSGVGLALYLGTV